MDSSRTTTDTITAMDFKDVKLTLQPKVILERLVECDPGKSCKNSTDMSSHPKQELKEHVIQTLTLPVTSESTCLETLTLPVTSQSECHSVNQDSVFPRKRRRGRPRKGPFPNIGSFNEELGHLEEPKKRRLSSSVVTEPETPANCELFSSTTNVDPLENAMVNGAPDQCQPNGMTVDVSEIDRHTSNKLKFSLIKDRAVEVHPDLMRHLKQHQHDGVHFLWNKLIRKPLLYNNNDHAVIGCILSQPSGLGKTVQVISFLHRVLTNGNLSDINTALILCLNDNIDHWMAEFSKWVPKETCNDGGGFNFISLIAIKDKQSYVEQMQTWKSPSGIMICEYWTFRSLIENSEKTNSNAASVERILTPDILICDDAHLLMQNGASFVHCLRNVKTTRKLFLSCAPIHNHLMEYHCIVSLLNEELLGDAKAFRKRFIHPIENGQHIDSTKRDVRLMMKRAYVLNELLSECMQRTDYPSLIECIPRKFEYTIKVKLSQLQGLLYAKYLSIKTSSSSESNEGRLFLDFNQFLLITCHPRCLIMQKEFCDKDVFQLSENGDDAIGSSDYDIPTMADTPEPTSLEDIHALSKEKLRLFIRSKGGECPKTKSRTKLINAAAKYLSKHYCKSREFKKLLMKKSVIELKAIITEYGGNFIGCTEKKDLVDMARKLAVQKVTASGEEWFEMFLRNTPHVDNQDGGKIVLMLKILQESCRLGDKVVLFSQSLITLDLIESILQDEAKVNKGTICAPFSKWDKRKDYFRLDGSVGSSTCSLIVSHFNDQNNRRGRLLLVLTSMSLTASLVGANRVILFDTSWCPSSDIQAISKVYRLGQTRQCYIYRLISHGTMEEKIYERNFVRPSFSYRTDSRNRVPKHLTGRDISELYTFVPKQEKSALFTRLQDDVFSSIINSDYIASFHECDTPRYCHIAHELSENERKAAWEEYRVDRGVKTLGLQALIRHINSLPQHTLMSLSTQGSDLVKKIEKMIFQTQHFEQPVIDKLIMTIRMKNRSISTDQANCEVIEHNLNNHLLLNRLHRLKTVLSQHLEVIQTAHQSNSVECSTPSAKSTTGVFGKFTVPLRGGVPYRPCRYPPFKDHH